MVRGGAAPWLDWLVESSATRLGLCKRGTAVVCQRQWDGMDVHVLPARSQGQVRQARSVVSTATPQIRDAAFDALAWCGMDRSCLVAITKLAGERNKHHQLSGHTGSSHNSRRTGLNVMYFFMYGKHHQPQNQTQPAIFSSLLFRGATRPCCRTSCPSQYGRHALCDCKLTCQWGQAATS